jgi:VanZ family protein
MVAMRRQSNRKKMTSTRKALITLFIAYTLLVSYLCLAPQDSSSEPLIWDKAAHALAYSGFAVLCCLIARNRKELAFLIAFCFLFGIGMEFLQGQTGYREASAEDQLANTIGLFLGWIVMTPFTPANGKKTPNCK